MQVFSKKLRSMKLFNRFKAKNLKLLSDRLFKAIIKSLLK